MLGTGVATYRPRLRKLLRLLKAALQKRFAIEKTILINGGIRT
jgi:hypothetical protein